MTRIGLLLMTASLCLGLYLICAQLLDTPEVQVSYSTKKCVKIVGPDGEKPCSLGLPERYTRVWVK